MPHAFPNSDGTVEVRIGSRHGVALDRHRAQRFVESLKDAIWTGYIGPDLWCFDCREYRMHYTVRMDEKAPGYYGPSWSQRCDRCDRSATDFLGGPRFILEVPK